jgi:hypothetical protein
VLRPLYESSAVLAQKTTIGVRFCQCENHPSLIFMYIIAIWRIKIHSICSRENVLYTSSSQFVGLVQALRHLRRLAQEASDTVGLRTGQQPAVLRGLSQRLAR